MNEQTVKYKTAGGKIVTWTSDGTLFGQSWTCNGCHDTGSTGKAAADQHARDCRAI